MLQRYHSQSHHMISSRIQSRVSYSCWLTSQQLFRVVLTVTDQLSFPFAFTRIARLFFGAHILHRYRSHSHSHSRLSLELAGFGF